MKTLKEKCQEVRNELKAMGITSKQVSVKGSYSMYDSSISVTIKDLSVNINKVKDIAMKQQEYDRCPVTYEILQGGNTYVRVSYDWQSVSEARKAKEEEAKRILEAAQGKESYTVADYGKTVVVFYNEGHMSTMNVLERPDGYEEMNCFCLDNKFRYTAHNIPHIAEALVYIENQMY